MSLWAERMAPSDDAANGDRCGRMLPTFHHTMSWHAFEHAAAGRAASSLCLVALIPTWQGGMFLMGSLSDGR